MKILGIALAAWLLGLSAYLGALQVIWGQRISAGDLRAVLFWSAFAAVFTAVVVFAPVMFRLRRCAVVGIANPWWVFVSAGTVLGVVPVMLIASVWSANIGRAIISPEAALFYCLFGIFGAVFGGGFYLAYGDGRTHNS